MNRLVIKAAGDTELFRITDCKDLQEKSDVKLMTGSKTVEKHLWINAR